MATKFVGTVLSKNADGNVYHAVRVTLTPSNGAVKIETGYQGFSKDEKDGHIQMSAANLSRCGSLAFIDLAADLIGQELLEAYYKAIAGAFGNDAPELTTRKNIPTAW